MTIRSRRIEDSRGRMRPVFPVSATWVETPVGPPRRAWPGTPWAQILWPLGTVVVLAAAMTPTTGGVGRQMYTGVIGATLGIAGSLFFFVYQQQVAPTYEAFTALLARGYCPACSYRIDSVPREPDGCTVCPECGGAWRR